MKIIQKKCPSCGGNLELESGELEGTCPFCNSDFIIDDDVVEVKIEIKNDYDFEIAVTTLDKFKEYDKAIPMFRKLLSRFGHTKEVYIYLVRAITHDFQLKDLDFHGVEEVNYFWNKYTALCNKKDLNKYSGLMNDFNYNYWKHQLKLITNKFDTSMKSVNLPTLEYIWKNFLVYASEENKIKYEEKYNDFLKTMVEKNNKSRRILYVIYCSIVFIILLVLFFFLTEKPKLKVDKINYSLLLNYKNNVISEESFLKHLFKNSDNIHLISSEYYKNKLYLDFKFKNFLKDESYNFTIILLDDRGPLIETKDCKFYDIEDVDLNSCVSVSDLTDEIVDDNITFDLKDSNFKVPGTYTVEVIAVDNEKNETRENLVVEIMKSLISVNLKINKTDLIEGDSTKLSYSINPNIVNKKVTIEYDNSILSIDDKLNVKALKKGSTDVCVVPEYDSSKKTCVRVNVSLKCKSSYTFKFSGGSEEKIVIGDDMCSGTYRITASTLSKKDAYHITYTPKSGTGTKFYTIWKSASSLSDEGSKIALEDGSTLKIPTGITKVTLK